MWYFTGGSTCIDYNLYSNKMDLASVQAILITMRLVELYARQCVCNYIVLSCDMANVQVIPL